MVTRMIENIQIEGKEYFSFPIEEAIEFSAKISTGFFVPLNSTKTVRIELEGNVESKLINYPDKGLKNILFAQSDYDRFLRRLKTGLSIFFFQELGEKKRLSDEQIFLLMRKSTKYIGIGEDICKIVEPLITQSLSFIKSSGQLGPLLKTYKKECHEQYIFHVFRCYLCVALGQALNWPPHLYDKFIQVSLICDLGLGPEDYESYYLHPNDKDKWTQQYREHPKLMARFLERHHSHNIGREVIKGVEQHEEHPNGIGFPYGMTAASFDQMTAILITARMFARKLLESEFSYDVRKEFIDEFAMTELSSNHMKNTCKALYRIMDLGDNED